MKTSPTEITSVQMSKFGPGLGQVRLNSGVQLDQAQVLYQFQGHSHFELFGITGYPDVQILI
jgi:hypothetical protein